MNVEIPPGLHESLQEQYSAFTKLQKRWIVFLVTLAAWFSTLSSFIYFPAVTALSRDLDTSISKINLTITSYLLVSAFAPSIVGTAADTLGRRPAYIVTLAVFIVANTGLALQNSFATLFVLRMIQAAGISGVQVLLLSTMAERILRAD